MQFSDKVALVTAAGAGIGQATARLFAERGATVIATDIDEAGLEETASDRPSIVTVKSDATSSEDVASVVQMAEERFGRLDFLINVVGGSRPGKTVTEIDEDEWDFWIRLNLGSTFLMCRAAIPLMAVGGGSIVNIASGAGVSGMGRNPAYVAAKGGVISLTKSLAIDHAAQGIRANVIAPGPILTPLMKRNRSEQEIAFMSKLSLVGRLGKPEEIAGTAAFLCSEDGGFVNGELINVAGGSGGPI